MHKKKPLQKIIFLNSYYYLPLLLIFLHLPFLLLSGINFESSFSVLANFFDNQNTYLLYKYLMSQYNSFAFSFIAYLVKKLLNLNIDYLSILRLFSLSGLLLYAVGFKDLSNKFKKKGTHLFLLCFLLSPLVWIFSVRATPDLFPSALAFFSIVKLANYIKIQEKKLIVFYILLFSVSILLKYHSLIYLFLLPYLLVEKRNNYIAVAYKCFFVFLVPFFLLCLYYFEIYKRYGFLIVPVTPEIFSTSYFSLNNIFLNFLLNLGFLFLFFFPLVPIKKLLSNKINIGIILISFLIYVTLVSLNLIPTILGEMNLGSLFHFINLKVIFGLIFLIYIPFFISIVIDNYKTDKVLYLCFTLAILLLSFIRPANRYLLFLGPFLYCILFNLKIRPKLIYSNLIIFICLNFIASLSFIATALTSKDMMDFIISKNLSDKVLYHETFCNVIERIDLIYTTKLPGQPFYLNSVSDLKYEVISGHYMGSLHTSEFNFLWYNKTLSLRPYIM